MKILITGGAGFLGSHLCDKLMARGDEVWVLDVAGTEKLKQHLSNPKFHFIRGSVLDEKIVDDLIVQCQLIYHFAAFADVQIYLQKPLTVLDVNILGTKNICESALKHKVKVLFASSSEVYGRNRIVPYFEESERVLGAPQINRWCYASSKSTAEQYLFAYHRLGLPIVIYRLFNIYGPRQDKLGEGRTIPIFLGQFLHNKPVTVADDGQQTRCFTYIADATEVILKGGTLSQAVGEVFNIGSTHEVSILDLAKKMKKIGDFKSEIQLVPYKKMYGKSYEDIRRRIPVVDKAKKILNWQATTPLAEGLRKTIEYYKKR